MRKLIFELQKKQQPGHDPVKNHLPWKKVEIVQFNYNSDGSTLVFADGEFAQFDDCRLDAVLFDGWYKLKQQKISPKRNSNHKLETKQIK